MEPTQDFEELLETHRLHPLTMAYRGIVSLPLAAFVLYNSFDGEGEGGLFAMVAFALFAIPGLVLSWMFFRYTIDETELYIESGVLARRKRSIPIERVQNVNIHQSFLQRLLGIAKVQVETAGGQASEGVLEFVSLSEANSIKEYVYAQRNVLRSTDNVSSESDSMQEESLLEGRSVDETEEKVLLEMPVSRVILKSVFQLSFVFVGIAVTLMPFFKINPENVLRDVAESQMESFTSFGDFGPLMAVFLMGLLMLVLGWLSGAVLSFLRYYGFVLKKRPGQMDVEHGLLSKYRGVIPLQKLQMMVVSTNPILQRWKLAMLQVQTAGLGVRGRGTEMAIPLASDDEVQDLVQDLENEQLPAVFTPVSHKTIRRAFVRYSLVLCLLTLPLAWYVPQLYWLLLVAPALLYGAILRFRYRGYVVTADKIYVKSGVWRRNISIIPRRKLQTVSVVSSWFQRRLGLASIVFDTAASPNFRDAAIVDIDQADAEYILQHCLPQ